MRHAQEHADSLLGAITAGAFLVLVGMLFVTTPNLFGKIVDFVKDFGITEVPNFGNINISLPAPIHPSAHAVVYQTAETFSIVWGIILIGILVLRYVFHASVRAKVDNSGGIVFWLGSGYLIGTMLNSTMNLQTWFVFWAEIIILIGVSLVVRAIVLVGYGLHNYQRNPRAQSQQV
jgi:hypothetical protein